MSALPQPDFQEVTASYYKSQASTASTAKISGKTTKLSRKKRSSTALQLLILLQKCSSILAAGTILSSMAIYLATVRIPQRWSQEYEHLEALQRQERNLVAMDEALKYEIARQAEQPELEMSAIAPENTLFLEANSKQLPQKEIAKANEVRRLIPLGY